MSVSFRVTPPGKQALRKIILRGIAKAVNAKFPKIQRRIQAELQTVIPDALRTSPEYTALTDGPLDAHFGFEAGTAKARVDRIIDVFSQHAEVIMIPLSVVGNGFRGGLEIKLSDTAMQALFSLPEARIVDMPWLEWLLLRGNSVIITGHKILFRESAFSRSGYAIMTKAKTGVWRVPSEYSGTETDNWITRAMGLVEKELSITISRIIADEL